MTILITGGTGKTGGNLAKLLQSANIPFLIATRSGKAPEPFTAVTFDWFNPETYENPFKADAHIDRVYIVCPIAPECLPQVGPFIDLAISKGVKRFVLLTATRMEPGSPGPGRVHQYLVDKGVDYAVLRPSWFIQNFGSLLHHNITENNKIESAAADGKIPWIACEDIAQAAFDALTAEKSLNKDIFVLGPELHSYTDAAKMLTEVLGREIIHKKNSAEEQTAAYISQGFPPEFVKLLVFVEELIAAGGEAKLLDDLPADRIYRGKLTLGDYLKENRQLWIKQ
ncbi:hypothetical protein D9613_008468 [Agrocybe pediades]|uniref:Agroclavine dehydrogenase n=1 Tax=Agrocybe pediades TaxID=84607 RepID=A0A8H4QUU1_9AGAR|nr:hypothetical protein D9613_008468 [Agrocybe pediades]